ncbi:uncharacterized protein [Gorilla gorilla gorilla]|uniref:uncharacterized protein n=1 Tax=Gorilla gorilla gorilla TaxID=9595 RepID=UPI002445B0A6|nr:uncharacterized protein LOC129524009 [Gorilla gorilla gorilla]
MEAQASGIGPEPYSPQLMLFPPTCVKGDFSWMGLLVAITRISLCQREHSSLALILQMQAMGGSRGSGEERMDRAVKSTAPAAEKQLQCIWLLAQLAPCIACRWTGHSPLFCPSKYAGGCPPGPLSFCPLAAQVSLLCHICQGQKEDQGTQSTELKEEKYAKGGKGCGFYPWIQSLANHVHLCTLLMVFLSQGSLFFLSLLIISKFYLLLDSA